MNDHDDNRDSTMTNTRHSLAGTAFGAIDGEFVYLTKRIRIPRQDILAVKPAADGNGAIVITERGATWVCEDYSALMFHLYGADVSGRSES